MYSSTSPLCNGLTRSGGVRRRTPRGLRSPTDSGGNFGQGQHVLRYILRHVLVHAEHARELVALGHDAHHVHVHVAQAVSHADPVDKFLHAFAARRAVHVHEELDSDGTTYYSARAPKSPSTASFKSLSSIPSISDYDSAIVETEYEIAVKCPSKVAETEFETAVLCPTPALTEYHDGGGVDGLQDGEVQVQGA